MQTIQSGATAERMVRTTLITLLAVVYAGWSLWDGYIVYPRRNVTAAITGKIGSPMPEPAPAPDPEITGDTAESLPPGTGIGELHRRLGDPHLTSGDASFYFGYGGYLTIVHDAGRVREIRWNRGPKYSVADLSAQRWIGWALTPIALIFVVQILRVLSTRASLSDDGLKVRGRAIIPLNTITGITSVAARASRRYAVHYADEGKSGVVHLDDYVVKDAGAIVSAICALRGLANPTESPGTSP